MPTLVMFELVTRPTRRTTLGAVQIRAALTPPRCRSIVMASATEDATSNGTMLHAAISLHCTCPTPIDTSYLTRTILTTFDVKLPRMSSGVMYRDFSVLMKPMIVPGGYPVSGVPGSGTGQTSVAALKKHVITNSPT